MLGTHNPISGQLAVRKLFPAKHLRLAPGMLFSLVYLPPAHNRGMDLSFVLRTKLPAASMAPAIRQAVWQVDGNVPVPAIRGMSEIVATSVAQRRFQTLLLAGFAGIAILLAALGIYGTLSYSVNQRYREIGIRLALGAQGRDIGTLLVGQALRPVM